MFHRNHDDRDTTGFGFLPDAHRVRRIDRAVAALLAGSLIELGRCCLGVIAIDQGALRRQAGLLANMAAIAPSVFVLHEACLEAARSDDPDALARRLAEIATVDLAWIPGSVRGFGDASLPDVDWQRMRRVLLAQPGSSLALAPAPADIVHDARGRLAEARSALATADPALAAETDVLVTETVFAAAAHRPDGFGGATCFAVRGTAFLNPWRHPTIVSMAAGLVHEAAHALLFGLSKGAPMVRNDPAVLYASPLRSDPRPMDGILHASFVSARMAFALQRLLAGDVLDTAERLEAAHAHDAACRAFGAGAAVVRAHGLPTATGGRVMDEATAFMQAASATG